MKPVVSHKFATSDFQMKPVVSSGGNGDCNFTLLKPLVSLRKSEMAISLSLLKPLVSSRKSETASLDTDFCVTVQGPPIGAGNRFLALWWVPARNVTALSHCLFHLHVVAPSIVSYIINSMTQITVSLLHTESAIWSKTYVR